MACICMGASNIPVSVSVRSLPKLNAAMNKLGMTSFQKAVLLEVRRIPKGNTATYKQIAERIGHPKAYRAVGTALRKNPFAPFVPCHRVIRGDGSIGNYSARGGNKAKLKLLKSEGAR